MSAGEGGTAAAATLPPTTDAGERAAGVPAPATPAESMDSAAEAAFYAPPPSPRDYELPSHQAAQRGLQVDFAVEQELRGALHAAGVDNALAASLYTAALGGAQRETTPLSLASDYAAGERSLRLAWGSDFDANLQAANAEGRRLFDAMPDSIKHGMTYAEYALAYGLANSAPIAKMLLARAQSRSRSLNNTR